MPVHEYEYAVSHRGPQSHRNLSAIPCVSTRTGLQGDWTTLRTAIEASLQLPQSTEPFQMTSYISRKFIVRRRRHSPKFYEKFIHLSKGKCSRMATNLWKSPEPLVPYLPTQFLRSNSSLIKRVPVSNTISVKEIIKYMLKRIICVQFEILLLVC